MGIIRHTKSGVEIVTTPERLDLTEAQELKDFFLDLVATDRTRIVINLSETKFVSSAGIGLFATLVKECSGKGGAVAFVNPHRVVIDILKVTKLINFFKIVDTVDEAVELVLQ